MPQHILCTVHVSFPFNAQPGACPSHACAHTASCKLHACIRTLRQDVGMDASPTQEGDVGLNAADVELEQSALHALDGLQVCVIVADDLLMYDAQACIRDCACASACRAVSSSRQWFWYMCPYSPISGFGPRPQQHHIATRGIPCAELATGASWVWRANASVPPAPARLLPCMSKGRSHFLLPNGPHLDQEGVVVPRHEVASRHGAVQTDTRAARRAVRLYWQPTHSRCHCLLMAHPAMNCR